MRMSAEEANLQDSSSCWLVKDLKDSKEELEEVEERECLKTVVVEEEEEEEEDAV